MAIHYARLESSQEPLGLGLSLLMRVWADVNLDRGGGKRGILANESH